MSKAAAVTLAAVTLDCADADGLAAFYCALLGWQITHRDVDETRLGGTGWIAISGPDGGVRLSFQGEDWYEPPAWPEEAGAQSKMLHFEMSVDGDLDSAVARVIELGGREAPNQPGDRDQRRLRVMLDPAGHPFCLCAD